MRFSFTSDQQQLRDAVRELLDRECPPKAARAGVAGDPGGSQRRWQALAQMGALGVLVPAEHGGMGMSEIDATPILEEAGRVALPEPYADTAFLAAWLIAAHAPEPLRKAWLPAIASGDARASAGAGDPSTLHVRLAPEEVSLVIDGHPVRLGDATVAAEAFDRAAFAASATLIGVASRAIEMAADYARERRQFGKPIGSFQAVKHLLADALVAVEFSKPVVYRAAHTLATRGTDRRRDVSMAKASASDAAVRACRAALQVHGAIGYTQEHDLHVWLARGFELAYAWGDAATHRARVAAAIGA